MIEEEIPTENRGKKQDTTHLSRPLDSFDLTLRVPGSLVVLGHLLDNDLIVFLSTHGGRCMLGKMPACPLTKRWKKI